MPSDRDSLKSDVFMAIAYTLSELGTCDRNRVGAVFVRDGRCISWGFNGAPPGMPHCSENMHGWEPLIRQENPEVDWGDPRQELYRLASEGVEKYGCRNATHAELNGLAFAARQGISVDGATLYVTLAPCLNCARALIAAGVQAVRFKKLYRDESGINLLRQAIEVRG